MSRSRVLYHMVRADFLERTRRYSFLLTLAGALYLAYGVATEKIWLVVGNGYRGVYNSAWIGMLMAICCSTFLSLVGFYIVKNSVLRDTATRVGRILAATPMRKEFYTFAKTLSNFAVLGCMVLVLMLAALVMQLLHSEGSSISLWKLWSPFILIALPAMFLTAALALLFETLPVLRGGVGNVFYFFFWTAGLALGVGAQLDDPTGLQLLYRSTRDALAATDPGNLDNFHFSLSIGGERAVRTFVWNGIDWTGHIVLVRAMWVVAAAALALLASVFFHRFDPAREWFRRRSAVPNAPTTVPEEQAAPAAAVGALSAAHLTAPPRNAGRTRLTQLVFAEIRLMLKGQRWWWYVVAAGLLIAELVSPTAEIRSGVLLFAWIWPVLIWSQMGCREARCATQSLIFSSERALARQLPALWTAGVTLALTTGGGVGIRLLLSADWRGLYTWIAAAVFIPTLALALGVCSGTSKPFEALYTLWWYMGPANRTPGLDFIGLTPASSSPAAYALAAAVLLGVAYFGRRARLAYV